MTTQAEELEKVDLAIPDYYTLRYYVGRQDFARTKSWAIPSSLAIQTIVNNSPVVEIGSGLGYWANFVRRCGGKIEIFDDVKERGHWGYKEKNCFAVPKQGSFEVLSKFPPRYTLFLCWPPYNQPLALNCLNSFRGNRFIYVGEDWGGCTGCDTFHEVLNEEWEETKRVHIPKWSGLRDSLKVYNRKRTK
jgi:hypothetical protein